jgi:hypothetical protein
MLPEKYFDDNVGYAKSQAKVIVQQTKLASQLSDDVEASGALFLGEPTSQFLRRTHIKTYFSYLEGVVWTFKRICLNPTFHIQSHVLSSGELAALKEETVRIDGSGNVIPTPLAISSKANIKFTFRILEKLFAPDFKVDYRR